jgi:hypothetical protein
MIARAAALAIALASVGCPGPAQAPADAECVVDRDCALLPYVTCCGECPPVPPFEVGTRQQLDAIFIELESSCAIERKACTPPVCEPMPEGCYAKAACEAGRCVVETEGCTEPRS